MDNRSQKLSILLPLLLGLSSCFQGPRIGKQSAKNQFFVSTQQSPDGVTSGLVQAHAGAIQAMTSMDADMAGASVAFPPGALAIDMIVSLEAGSSIAHDKTMLNLGFNQASVSAASRALVVSGSEKVDALQPFTLQIPFTAQGLALTAMPEYLVVLYRVQKNSENNQIFEGIIPTSQIRVENGIAVFQTRFFGAFQVAYVNQEIKEEKTQVTTQPILTKREESSLPPITWTKTNATIQDGVLYIKAQVTGLSEEMNCSLIADEDQQAPWDHICKGFKGTDAKIDTRIDNKHCYDRNAKKDKDSHISLRFICEDAQGRLTNSPWSKKVTIPHKPSQAQNNLPDEEDGDEDVTLPGDGDGDGDGPLLSKPALANITSPMIYAKSIDREISPLVFDNSGTMVTECLIQPNLPGNMLIGPVDGTCKISGMPTTTADETEYTITATSADGGTDTATVTITVRTGIAPSLTSTGNKYYYVDSSVSEQLFTKNTNGEAAVTCQAKEGEPLPDGLEVEAYDGGCRIFGTPESYVSSMRYHIIATGIDGSFIEVSVDIEVMEAASPPILVVPAFFSFIVNDSIYEVFDNTGGNVTSCNVVLSDLPPGIGLSTTTFTPPSTNSCVISGTPTESGTWTFSVQAFGAGGMSNTVSVTINVGEGALISCPLGYIPVPAVTVGSHGIDVPAFCVMKYEAKNDDGAAASTAATDPWVNIDRTAADTACKDISMTGFTFDLISNAQWQSIARQIELYKVNDEYMNWQNKSTDGTHSLNHGNSAGDVLEAGADANGCFGVEGVDDDCGNEWNLNKRTHTLPNGEVIWDLAGNAWEWVKDDNIRDYGAELYISQITESEAKLVFGPYGNYSTTKTSFPHGGLGYGVIDYDSGAITRGGYLDKAGVFAVALNRIPDYAGQDTGFRCVAMPID